MTDLVYRESDIDLVIRFSRDVIYNNRKKIITEEGNDLKIKFDRRIDIHEYDDFIMIHPKTGLNKIFETKNR